MSASVTKNRNPGDPRLSAHDVSDYLDVLARADKIELHKVHRQKLLVLIQAEAFIELGRPIFFEAIEAWKMGPVISTIWKRFKWPPSLQKLLHPRHDQQQPSREEKELIEAIWDRHKLKSGSTLSEQTHQWVSWKDAWERRATKDEVGNVPIRLEALAADVRKDNKRVSDRFSQLVSSDR